MEVSQLVEGLRRGEVRAVARAISTVERGGTERDELMRRLEAARPDAGPPRILGLTGPPGAGKSTLIASLIVAAREAGDRVAVLAFDPTSPFSGGALLGDRLRMNRHGSDPGIYIRSMATRGHGGGLSAAALEAAIVLGAADFDTVLIESVGVGQTEVGILSVADVVAVILNPGAGDEIQTLKAGVMEIGDLYVVNKADLPGADDLHRALLRAQLVSPNTSLAPEFYTTVAETGKGVGELYHAMTRRVAALEDTGELASRRQARLVSALEQLAGDLFRAWVRRTGVAERVGTVPFGVLRERLSAVLARLTTEMEEDEDD